MYRYYLATTLLIVLSLLVIPTTVRAELVSPTITISPDIYYPFEEILYLEGTSGPEMTVEIKLQKIGARPLTYTVRSKFDGEWVLAEKIPLSAGQWEVRARLLVDKEFSAWSNPRLFKVVISGVTLGGWNIKFASLTLLFVVLLIFGAVLALVFGLRIRSLKSALITKEVREAQDSVRTGVAELKQEVLDELKSLNSKRALSADKLSRRDHLFRELERIEHQIERDIGDIDKRT